MVHSSKAVGEPPFYLGEQRRCSRQQCPCCLTPFYESQTHASVPCSLSPGVSAFFALKDAVSAARSAAGLPPGDWFNLDLPATPERLRMACADELTAPFAAPDLQCKLSC